MNALNTTFFPPPGSLVTVYKRDELGRPLLNYLGKVLAHSPSSITLQAIFEGDPVSVAGIDAHGQRPKSCRPWLLRVNSPTRMRWSSKRSPKQNRSIMKKDDKDRHSRRSHAAV